MSSKLFIRCILNAVCSVLNFLEVEKSFSKLGDAILACNFMMTYLLL